MTNGFRFNMDTSEFYEVSHEPGPLAASVQSDQKRNISVHRSLLRTLRKKALNALCVLSELVVKYTWD